MIHAITKSMKWNHRLQHLYHALNHFKPHVTNSVEWNPIHETDTAQSPIQVTSHRQRGVNSLCMRHAQFSHWQCGMKSYPWNMYTSVNQCKPHVTDSVEWNWHNLPREDNPNTPAFFVTMEKWLTVTLNAKSLSGPTGRHQAGKQKDPASAYFGSHFSWKMAVCGTDLWALTTGHLDVGVILVMTV